MTYIKGVADQTYIFCHSFGFGFVLGIVYDIFRIVRLVFSGGRKAVFAADILYFALCTLLTFCFALVFNEGQLRGYILAGEMLGWSVYYFSLGTLAVKLGNKAVALCKRLLLTVWRVITAPIKFAFRIIRRIFKRFALFITKINRKTYKKTKIHLQNRHKMLYNFISCIRKKV